MKKMAFCIVSLVIVFVGCASRGTAVAETNSSSPGMDMDAAIREAAVQMETKIPSKTMVALVSVASPSTAFSTQVLTRLESAIVSSGKLVVVDRANLDKVREEQGFQLSGEVDDESAKSIGKLLGAGAIVTGSLADLGDVYSLTLKAINIETATVAVSYLADLAKSARIETLMASGGGTAGTQTAQRGNKGGNTPVQSATPANSDVKPSTPVQVAVPKNGTYTFFPRLRAWRGANNVDAYLDRIVVRNGYVTVYLKGTASGDDDEGYRFMNFSHWHYNNSHMDFKWWVNWGDHYLIKDYMNKVHLQDVDNPSKTYKAIDVGMAEDGGRYYSFQNVQGTKFKLSDGNNPPNFFEEIVLEDPDQ